MNKFWGEVRDVWAEAFGRFKEGVEFEWRYRVVKARLWSEERAIDSTKVDDQDTFDYVQHKYAELEPHWEGLRLMETRRVSGEAARAGVKLPDQAAGEFYGKVEWDNDPDEPHYLTDKGMQIVVAALREARKERRDAIAFRFGIFVGVIGALTGLVSVFR